MVHVESRFRTSLGERYDIEGEVGRGGMSIVYRAQDLKHNRTVAIKVLRPELSEQISAERFLREIEVVAGLTHPHILPLHDSGEADGLLYFVMPFVEDGSLRARLDNEGALPEADAIRIAAEIADALGYAHRHGVVHRDVKPGNILISGEHALLADFGIAHLAASVQETLTLAGLALGTPAYLSPEQASGEREIDGRSDIYSLGCVLYEALTGSPPFSSDSVRAMLVHQIVDTPPAVRLLNDRVSPAAEAVVETALRKEPDERFQTAEQMAVALATVGAGIWGLPALLFRRLGLPHRQANRAAIVAIAIATAASVALFFTMRDRWEHVEAVLPRPEVRYIVLDYSAPDATDEEIEFSVQAARLLRDRLRDWGSVTVVSEAAMEGPTAEIRTAGVGLSSHVLDTGLAERFNADFRVRVQVRRGFEAGASRGSAPGPGNGVVVEATVFRIPEERQFETYPAAGPADSLAPMITGIALDLLELEAPAEEWETLLRRSPDHRAVAAYDTARIALHSWRLSEAHRLLERAIERDTTFALAHYLLAQTMYWEMARDEERLFELGPRIAHHVYKADRYGDGRLRARERSSVTAFSRFWSGDYDSARVLYDTLIAREPSDLESLVMRGAVEIEDPIAVPDSAGKLLPRRDLNVAMRMFDIAVSLNPEWDLAWGHLNSIVLLVRQTAWHGRFGQGFEPPEAEPVTPYERDRNTEDQLWFCPIVDADSIAWREYSYTGCPLDQAAREAASRLYAGTVERLVDWMTSVGLDRPRHHEELTELLLQERGTLGCEGDPILSDSLLDAAQLQFEIALELQADTTPQQRVRLANLYLVRGEVSRALAAAERALVELPDWEDPRAGTPPPLAAANPFLAAGQAELAAQIVVRVWGENSMALRNPLVPDSSINAQGQLGRLNALKALGTSGMTGPEVGDQISRLQRAWRTDSLSDRDRVALRLASLSYVEPALVHFPAEWDDWFSGWDEYGLQVPPVWQGFLAAVGDPPDMVQARNRLEESVAALGADPDDGRVTALDLYLPILLARLVEASDTEIELMERLSGCTPRLDSFDAGWGVLGSLGGIH
jgi:tRNA A-37 threonylcarbamoyl transferase component Bud32/tetratricopeptide (TPR) repeat protein